MVRRYQNPRSLLPNRNSQRKPPRYGPGWVFGNDINSIIKGFQTVPFTPRLRGRAQRDARDHKTFMRSRLSHRVGVRTPMPVSVYPGIPGPAMYNPGPRARPTEPAFLNMLHNLNPRAVSKIQEFSSAIKAGSAKNYYRKKKGYYGTLKAKRKYKPSFRKRGMDGFKEW